MFDLEDYVVASDDESETRHHLRSGTHSVFLSDDAIEHGRVFVASSNPDGEPDTTQHWILRPSFRSPRRGGPDMIVRALAGNPTLADLFAWGREVPGSVYVRAACAEVPIPK